MAPPLKKTGFVRDFCNLVGGYVVDEPLKIDEKEVGCLGVIVNGVKNACVCPPLVVILLRFPCSRKLCQSLSVVVPFTHT